VGRALCVTLVRLGAQVVTCDVTGADLAGEAYHFDLRDRDATLAAAGAILSGGAPSVVISNAGWTRAETFGLCTPDAVDDEMGRNFTGARISPKLSCPPCARPKGTAPSSSSPPSTP
jgi:NAD(P)-dependent dehydrogenase (short-subunit alcohol dehydrogenase family)